ncbi:MAG: response regulator transcription factor [Acidimicrobiia bacterium]|nr:response regulator transcription factor [Acidimicrobiia bacterium]MDQ3500797.1 response regulator transcription factor [Actinomycetota bacterium]
MVWVRILVVDDEPRVREVVATYLLREGWEVATAADGETARRQLDEFAPELMVLDVMLPGVSGTELLAEIRRRGDLPVILLTARTDEADRISGLELGADDYVVKPFSPRELVARVRSVMRRSTPKPNASSLQFDDITIDLQRRAVAVEGAPVEVTAREFDLLAFLATNAPQVFTRAELLQKVWNSSTEWQDPATVTVHVRRLRQKIEVDPQHPRWLTTVWGVGYRFEP